jgi:hypothetical protein
VDPLQVDPGWIYGAATVENVGLNNVAPCAKQINLSLVCCVSIGAFTITGTGYK